MPTEKPHRLPMSIVQREHCYELLKRASDALAQCAGRLLNLDVPSRQAVEDAYDSISRAQNEIRQQPTYKEYAANGSAPDPERHKLNEWKGEVL